MKLTKLGKRYLTLSCMVSVKSLDNVTPKLSVGDTLNEVTSHLKGLGVTHIGECSLQPYWHRRVQDGYPEEEFVPTEVFLRKLRDELDPKRSIYVGIKLETCGLHHWDRTVGKRGSEIYPILQVAVKPLSNPTRVFYIKPSSDVDGLITNNVRRLLEERGNILERAKLSKMDLACAENEIMSYLTECEVLKYQYKHLVCLSSSFAASFISDQLPRVCAAFSPKYVDVVAYNNMLEACGEYDKMVYPHYKTNSTDVVDEMMAHIESSRLSIFPNALVS